VQSGRMFGSKAFTYVPSVTEGVLDPAERGGYRQRPGTVATPLDQTRLTRLQPNVFRLDRVDAGC
jgi:hypothetical protein